MNISYLTNNLNSFVNLDIKILREFATVRIFKAEIKSKKILPIKLLHQILFVIKNLYWTQIYICQFAGYVSFVPVIASKIFRKKCIIISGGTDCVNFKKINYGNFSKKIYGFVTKISFRYASAVIVPHEHLIESENTYSELGSSKQGIKAHFPRFDRPFYVIPNVVDTNFWSCDVTTDRNGIVTVATGFETNQILVLKGIDHLIQLAKLIPEIKITIVGYRSIPNFIDLPKNVSFLPILKSNELRVLYSRHQFYAQLSVSEGWGVALCEAMSCGCVPIVSNVGAMPYIVDDSGYIIEKRNIDDLVNLIQRIKNDDMSSLSAKAKHTIKSNFDLPVRSKLLRKVINEIYLK